MTNLIEQISVPDLGGVDEVNVIEILVKPGDSITKEESLITLEANKASMDVSSPLSGKIKDIQVKVGDKLKEGDKILTIEVREEEASKKEKYKRKSEKEEKKEFKEKDFEEKISEGFGVTVHAGPAVRRIANEFGIDLTKIKGTGQKDRLLKEDVQKFVKQQLKISTERKSVEETIFPSTSVIDFSKFGAFEEKPLSKIKKAVSINLSRNWITIPHVTQFGEADITELETFRQSQKEYATKQNVRLTLLVFIIKVVVSVLKEFPNFNASLDYSGNNLILKKYFHIGIAVNTQEGLVVPVIRDADKKGLFELAKELKRVSEKAHTNRLSLNDIQGGCFSISSLGGIGGTTFTPIINAPEVAILGISEMQWKRVYNKREGDCKTRLMLPLSLSYDHRVIDGVDGARFIVYLTALLSDIRMLLL